MTIKISYLDHRFIYHDIINLIHSWIQRAPEKPCLNDVTDVGTWRQTALIVTLVLVVLTLLPLWDELAEELGVGLVPTFWDVKRSFFFFFNFSLFYFQFLTKFFTNQIIFERVIFFLAQLYSRIFFLLVFVCIGAESNYFGA